MNKKSIPTKFYIKLLELVLQSNIFEFDREYFIQLLGTAMGTRVAPTYANIFMAKLEKFMLRDTLMMFSFSSLEPMKILIGSMLISTLFITL